MVPGGPELYAYLGLEYWYMLEESMLEDYPPNPGQ
jgi:hypothetical protein